VAGLARALERPLSLSVIDGLSPSNGDRGRRAAGGGRRGFSGQAAFSRPRERRLTTGEHEHQPRVRSARTPSGAHWARSASGNRYHRSRCAVLGDLDLAIGDEQKRTLVDLMPL
jgi:hypothetical protein